MQQAAHIYSGRRWRSGGLALVPPKLCSMRHVCGGLAYGEVCEVWLGGTLVPPK